VSQQYQPNQPYGQQPGWGAPPPPAGFPPPPKKNTAGKIIGLGCAGIIGLFIVIGIISAVVSGGGSDNKNDDATEAKPAASATQDDKPAAAQPSKAEQPSPAGKKTETPKKQVVTFKVWGTAPAGTLGPLDITYGSDSDTRQGTFKNGKFEATMPVDSDALFFNVMAQLQGSGDIQCSVTVDGHVEKAHASGGYNICHAQANAGILGGWD
jgi:hypothetical protein